MLGQDVERGPRQGGPPDQHGDQVRQGFDLTPQGGPAVKAEVGGWDA
jgi:hypothetical protein